MPKPEVSSPTKECPEPERWQCYDDMTAEVEVLQFLQQLVRTIKPHLIVETGSYRGIAASYIGAALKEVGRGKLITCEINHELYQQTVRQCADLEKWVECRKISSLEMEVPPRIDILFADSDPSARVPEIKHFWNALTPSSLILVHDVNSGAHLGLRLRVLALDTVRTLSVVVLPTPRGLAICQKIAGR